MRILKSFEEYKENGIVRKRTPDNARSRSLTEEAAARKAFLNDMKEKIGLSDGNANYFIENSYDILIGVVRASMLREGLFATGEGAHEAEVSFMRTLGFSEGNVRFMNELRYFRNGILYYGKRFNSEYAKRVLEFLEKAYPKINK
jgi:hypothetical protein